MKKPFLAKNRIITVISTVLVISVCITVYSLNVHSKHEYLFETVRVEKGSVSNVVTATGTLEATNTVVVGTQVSGVIEKIYVDFNSPVKKGQLLAILDKSTLQYTLENAEAEVSKAQAEYIYQKAQFDRMKVLYDKDLLSASDYDLANYNYKKSEAELKSAKANLKKASKNLQYATIYSPINGIILNRAVEEGQTVAASMNTPELFTITNDLSTMQVEANVDEADIGLLKLDQRVEFTVDAFPDLTFDGSVSEIRLQPNESANVITYVAIVTVSNPELKLKPGLTASITIYTEEANDVLTLVEKATRFTPNREVLDNYMNQLSEKQQKLSANVQNSTKVDSKPAGPPDTIQEADDSHKTVWVKNRDHLYPVVIEMGIDDGTNIEIRSGLEEGTMVVTSFSRTGSSGSKNAVSKNNEQKSPFVQQRPKGGGGPPR